jgi:hypothetical protein
MKRVYGRVTVNGVRQWVVVPTDAAGFDSNVALTALCQTLLLQTGESPFWASSGVNAQQSVNTGVPPDFAVAQIQAFYASFFASLIIQRASGANAAPVYNARALTFQGSILTASVAI